MNGVLVVVNGKKIETLLCKVCSLHALSSSFHQYWHRAVQRLVGLHVKKTSVFA